ncbi:phosphotransferase [Fervidicella metallireducens AeB]|uniref:Phosphotransferase n=1 Tax=Fervidicella metallireducens AeB TaxID=1403537 RepID=A0A017RVJ5_9CLOT|nr:PHP domain-containing protein [Fervidicella metallireducens]EYE88702.1 phosphotransferase [Fervidicella metallireducens AeB]
MLNKADLHIHTTVSDGELDPEEVVIMAKISGIDLISITDHNSTEGIQESVNAGKTYGINVIPGIELSTKYKGEKVHILGYFKSNKYNDSIFQNILQLLKCDKTKDARKEMNKFMNTVTSGNKLSVLEGIDLLRAFDASVALAHPIRINKKILSEVLQFPFDGIELKYCASISDNICYFDLENKDSFSFYTAGSDFHTTKTKNTHHSVIGKPHLDSYEIALFLENSKALVL